MAQWYLSYDGKQVGPLEHEQAATQARSNPNGFAWRGAGSGRPDRLDQTLIRPARLGVPS